VPIGCRLGIGPTLDGFAGTLPAESRRALAMLATSGRDGATRPLLVAHDFGVPMINALVSQGLSALTFEKVQAGGILIDVGKVRITDAGPRAIEG
jgi:hypothetical protein